MRQQQQRWVPPAYPEHPDYRYTPVAFQPKRGGVSIGVAFILCIVSAVAAGFLILTYLERLPEASPPVIVEHERFDMYPATDAGPVGTPNVTAETVPVPAAVAPSTTVDAGWQQPEIVRTEQNDAEVQAVIDGDYSRIDAYTDSVLGRKAPTTIAPDMPILVTVPPEPVTASPVEGITLTKALSICGGNIAKLDNGMFQCFNQVGA